MGIAKGTVQADGSFVPVHNLKIRLCGAEAPSFFQNGLADGAGVIPVPVIRVDVDRVQPDVLPVQNSKAGGDDRSGSVAFEKVPVDASSKLSDEHMDSIEPYNYKELRAFSTAYLPGFLADKFDVTVEQCRQRADLRCEGTFTRAMRKTSLT